MARVKKLIKKVKAHGVKEAVRFYDSSQPPIPTNEGLIVKEVGGEVMFGIVEVVDFGWDDKKLKEIYEGCRNVKVEKKKWVTGNFKDRILFGKWFRIKGTGLCYPIKGVAVDEDHFGWCLTEYV
ncbi:MAG: hypothetical protein D6681_21795 [Calditrichaeota bacterium]|nr:MAG: hypothetical protein D6681_21795 [Calditrichota bacterium]